jgi:hypothetical protein
MKRSPVKGRVLPLLETGQQRMAQVQEPQRSKERQHAAIGVWYVVSFFGAINPFRTSRDTLNLNVNCSCGELELWSYFFTCLWSRLRITTGVYMTFFPRFCCNFVTCSTVGLPCQIMGVVGEPKNWRPIRLLAFCQRLGAEVE